MDLRLDDRERDLLQRAIAFAEREVAPKASAWEDAACLSTEALKAASKAGLSVWKCRQRWVGLAEALPLRHVWSKKWLAIALPLPSAGLVARIADDLIDAHFVTSSDAIDAA